MPLPALLENRLRLPVVAAPMFLVSNPDLVLACCNNGIVERTTKRFWACVMRRKKIVPFWQHRICVNNISSGNPSETCKNPSRLNNICLCIICIIANTNLWSFSNCK